MPTLEWIRQTAAAITLVSALPDHAELLYAMFTGENTRRYSPVTKTSVERLAKHLGKSGKDFSEKAPYYRFFGRREDDFFGTCIFKNIDWQNNEAEIGFCLLDQWHGQGLGPALVLKCINKVFAETEIGNLWATVAENNTVCRKMLYRLGFKEHGYYPKTFLVNNIPTSQMLYRIARPDDA